MCIVDRAYGYWKSTFAKAALFRTVTMTLLNIHTSSQKAYDDDDGGGGGNDDDGGGGDGGGTVCDIGLIIPVC